MEATSSNRATQPQMSRLGLTTAVLALVGILLTIAGCGGAKGVTLRFNPRAGTASTYVFASDTWSQMPPGNVITSNIRVVSRSVVDTVSSNGVGMRVTIVDAKSKINGQSMHDFTTSLVTKQATLTDKQRKLVVALADLAFAKREGTTKVIVSDLGNTDGTVDANTVGFSKDPVRFGDSWEWVVSAADGYKMQLTLVREETRNGVACYLLHGAPVATGNTSQVEGVPVKESVKEDNQIWIERATGELVEMVLEQTSQTFIGRDPKKQMYMSHGTLSRTVRIDKHGK